MIIEEIDCVYDECSLLLFEYKIKQLNIRSKVEENNFSLVHRYLSGNITKENDYNKLVNNYDGLVSDVMLEKGGFIEKSIEQITDAVETNSIKADTQILKELKNRLQSLKELAKNYYVIRNIHNEQAFKGSYRLLKEAESRVIYGIIELRASLGLSTAGITVEKIQKYCRALMYDINNDKYERLSFQEHITEEGKINYLKK